MFIFNLSFHGLPRIHLNIRMTAMLIFAHVVSWIPQHSIPCYGHPIKLLYAYPIIRNVAFLHLTQLALSILVASLLIYGWFYLKIIITLGIY